MDKQLALVIGVGMIAVSFVVRLVLDLAKLRRELQPQERHPPLPEELHRDFVNKHDFDLGNGRLREDIGHLFDLVRTIERSVSKSFSDISNQIGNLSGRIEEHVRQEGRRK